jgi:RNA polymerase sigma-70 factor (ECF subfamily)
MTSAPYSDFIQPIIERVFREDAGRILAGLIAATSDFTLAEDALQDAIEAALRQWPREGAPRQPGAWLATIARRKAIDRLRRDQTYQRKQAILQALVDHEIHQDAAPTSTAAAEDDAGANYPDERLKLLFTCCHPALALDARIALTLRTLGGLTTEEIARAFLVSETTMAQRLTRARRKIHDAGIPYRVPPLELLPERLEGVLATLYLIFNEGYDASAGATLIRRDLCDEAIRLTRMLLALLAREPSLVNNQPEAQGLLALMLLIHARRHARATSEGDLITLEEQNRSRWDRVEIAGGLSLLDHALLARRRGPYQIQAAINAIHDQAESAATTDWRQIALLYEALAQLAPSPVVALNHAVAVAMAAGLQAGLTLIDAPALADALRDYLHYHAARADLLRRAGHFPEAAAAYRQALTLCQNQVERRYLERRLAEVSVGVR